MSWLHAARQRLQDLLAPGAGDQELRDEIAHHLELETARQIGEGRNPAVARWAALERFGDPESIADAARVERGSRPWEGAGQDLHWAIRSLRKSPGFVALAIGTITLGIAATTVAFAVLDTVLLRPLPYRNPGQLVLIRERTTAQTLLAPSYPNFVSWRERAHSFDGIASTTFPGARFVWPASDEDDAVRATTLGISRHFFTVLGVAPIVGRDFTEEESKPGGPAAVMVSYEFWQSQMGGRSVLGSIGAGERTPVVGVLPPHFQFRSPVDLFYSNERSPEMQRTAHNYIVVARLKPGVTLDRANADMSALSKTLLATFGNGTQAVDADLVLLRDYLVADYKVLPPIVFGAAALVLLIACANLMSAQLARSRTRESEIVVRAALGAPRYRLVRQLVFETVLLTAVGAALATVVSVGAVKAIATTDARLMPRLAALSVDARVLGFATAAAVFTALIVGVYPALRLANRDAGLVLRNGGTGGLGVRAAVWRVLVGFEVALAMVLLVGSALLIQTFHNILTSDTGFDSHGVLTVSLTQHAGEQQKLDALLTSVGALRGVSGAAFTTRLPLAWETMSSNLRRVGDPRDHSWPGVAGFRVISKEYFAVLRQPVLSGRAFTAADRRGSVPVAIITPGIAKKLWPGQDPLGKLISTNFLFDQWLTVVGVVAEASSWTMPHGSQNEIYVPMAQHLDSVQSPIIAILRVQSSTDSVIPAVRAALHEIMPGAPAIFGTMEERIARSAADRRFAMLALSAFGVIALVLAMVGIYGAIWYIVATRAREIGVRMALGATARTVRRDVLRGALFMTVGGIATGIAASAFATRYFQSTLFGVSPLDPRLYATAAMITLITAISAAYVPARRSSCVDPLLAIRGE